MATIYIPELSRRWRARLLLRKKGLLPPVKRSKTFLRDQPVREMILQGARMEEVHK